MIFYLGVTDIEWFRFLSKRENEDINFWQPGGNAGFRILKHGAPFLFKLKSPINMIGGVGFFSSHAILPLDVAWNIFGERNGIDSYFRFRQKIINYRSSNNPFELNPNIGCIVLTDPFFFHEKDWIPMPADWNRSIVQGKSYDTSSMIGNALWQKVDTVLQKYRLYEREDNYKSQLIQEAMFLADAEPAKKYLTKIRLGQAAFRVQLTDTYQRRCSITGEKTLPALEAAHIKPFSESGPYYMSNGILLRADLHKLYDSGYITVTRDYRVEVSKRIREKFENGKEYYRYDGKELLILPKRLDDQPHPDFIEWHNNNIYNG